MKFITAMCVLLATSAVANASTTFTVYNSGGYVIKLTTRWVNTASGKVETWQSGGISLGKSVSKTAPDTAQEIDYEVNVDMIGFPEIFHKSYTYASDMKDQCTNFKVWGTIFWKGWDYTCKKDSDGVYIE